jgi:HEAT repeat protein
MTLNSLPSKRRNTMIHLFNLALFLGIFLLGTGSIDLHAGGGKKTSSGPKYPDITKGEPWEKPEDKSPHGQLGFFNLGPTGMMGFMIGGDSGEQILVELVFPNSPASGKLIKGDVILGVGGQRFEIGGKMTEIFGAAINEAEKESNGGKLTLSIWRDKNYIKRMGALSLDMSKVDVDDIFTQVEEDKEGAVFSWMDKAGQDESFKRMQEEKMDNAAKMDPVLMDVTIDLEVMGSFSKTSPHNCPKVDKILERGMKVVRKRAKKGVSGRGHGLGRYFMVGHALMAYDDPEDMKLVKEFVHNTKMFKPDRKISTWGFHYGSWYSGYQGTFLGEYYLKTKDEYVIPAFTEIATKTAMGQTYGGSWGHSFSSRSFNYGKINMRSSGYGAMNQAGGPCFLALAFAKYHGITNSHIEAAISRSSRFYGSISEIGATPYGMHPTANYADSNGKNGPPAFAFKLLGEETHADYFAQCQSVAAWWGHGGHNGGEWGAIWRTLGPNLIGPKASELHHKDRRNWYTMARRHDGGFVLHWPTGGPFFRDDATSLYMLRYMGTRRTTILTGRDPMPSIQATEEDLQDIIDGNASEKELVKLSTDELFERCRTFYPNRRDIFSRELGRRYQEAGEQSILPRALKMLKDPLPRKRAAAVLTLGHCGEEVVVKHLSDLFETFEDSRQFVRINAIRALEPYFLSLEGQLAEQLMRLVTRDEYWKQLNDNNAVPTYVFRSLFKEKNRKKPDMKVSQFGNDPYSYGVDQDLTREALERGFQWDPGRSQVLGKVAKSWDKRQVIDMAGPIVFGAEMLQMNDMMFAGGSLSRGRQILNKHGFTKELVDAVGHDLIVLNELPRTYYPRAEGHYRASGDPIRDAKLVLKSPELFTNLLPVMRRRLTKDPLETYKYPISREKTATVYNRDLISMIAKASSEELISIYPSVQKMFRQELDEKGSDKDKMSYARSWLNPKRKTYFRQMASMSYIIEQEGAQGLSDLVPYFKHDHLRWRNHSLQLAKKLGNSATNKLIELYTSQSDDRLAAGVMASMSFIGDPASASTALKAMKEGGPLTRGEAVQALTSASGSKHLSEILIQMRATTNEEELDGFEKALLSLKGKISDEDFSKSLMAEIRKSKQLARRSIYYLLAQIGGEKNLDLLLRVSRSKSEEDFLNVVNAVSFSRDPLATQWMADVITANKGTPRAIVATKSAVKRMVLGKDDEAIGSCDNKDMVKFARQVLKVNRNGSILRTLGWVHSGPSADLMFKYMKLGPANVTEAASDGIITLGRTMSSEAPLDDRRRASEVLGQVIEYMTVTFLRVPEEERSFKEYPKAKMKVDLAGKAMLRIYDPDEEVLEDIDDDDIDI